MDTHGNIKARLFLTLIERQMETGKDNLNRQIQLIFENSSLSLLSATDSVSRTVIYSSAQKWVAGT